jgi:uncharacterized protein YecT (DUF1311 family)
MKPRTPHTLKILLYSMSFIAAALLAIVAAIPVARAQAQAASTGVGALIECTNATQGQSRQAMQPCLRDRIKDARAKMKSAYEKAERDLKQTGASGAQQAVKSLAESQRIFERFVRAECKREGDAALGGSGAGDFERACEADLLRWRTTMLAGDTPF